MPLKDLEARFTSEMSWDNYGSYWHIDHIIPISWFKNEQQILKKGYNLKNLQPLNKELNLSKNNKYVYDIQKNPINSEIYLLPEAKEVMLNG